MDLFINIFHVVLSILLILVIILQPSKGSDIGAAFGGGGGSSTMFGPRGAGSVLSKATTVIAVLFMVTSITLAMRSVPKGGAGTSLSDDGTLEGLDGIDLGLDDLNLGLDLPAEEAPSDALETTENGESLDSLEGDTPSEVSGDEENTSSDAASSDALEEGSATDGNNTETVPEDAEGTQPASTDD